MPLSGWYLVMIFFSSIMKDEASNVDNINDLVSIQSNVANINDLVSIQSNVANINDLVWL
jgi:hypothetical protein